MLRIIRSINSSDELVTICLIDEGETMLLGVWGRKRSLLVTAMAALVALLIAGCGSTNGGGSTGGAEDSGTPQPGGTLNVALAEELNTLEPQEAINPNETWVVSQIDEPLWRENAEEKLVPWLIEKVQTSDGERVWTLTLKSGIEFSNGQPMT